MESRKSSTPRADIVDTARLTRTITLHDAVVDLFHKKELRDVSCTQPTNGTFLFDQITSFKSPEPSSVYLPNRPVDSIDTDSRTKNTYPPCQPPLLSAHSKSSIWSTFVKRMSLPRRKREGNVTSNSTYSEDHSKSNRHTSNSKLRRWFTRRLTKATENCTEQDNVSSAMDVNKHSLPNGLSCEKSPVNPVAEFSDVTERPFTASSSRSGTGLVSDHMVTSESQHCNDTETSFAIELLRRFERLQTLPRSSTVSPVQNVSTSESQLVRRHSSRSLSDRSRLRVNFASTEPIEQKDLRRTIPVCSLSDAELFDSHSTPNRGPRISPVNKVLPSYLSISLAAFGYSGHNLDPWALRETNTSRPNTLSISLSPSKLNQTASQNDPISCHLQTKPSAPPPSVLHSLSSGILEESKFTVLVTKQNGLTISTTIDSNEASPCLSPSDQSGSMADRMRVWRPKTRNHTATPEEQEHWQRSSLIMMAVSQASPRPKAQSIDLEQVADEESQQLTKDATVHMNGHDLDPELKSTMIDAPKDTSLCISDAQGFLRELAHTQGEIMTSVEQTERYLENETFDNEVSGLLRAAVGKARLLVSEKFVQFRGLCQQNIDWEESQKSNTAVSGDLMPTLLSDLEGFWEVVKLQVTDVHRMFDQIAKIKENGWKVLEPVVESDLPTVAKPLSNGKTSRRKTSVSQTLESECARLKARERLQSIKREMRAKKLSEPSNEANDCFLIIE